MASLKRIGLALTVILAIWWVPWTMWLWLGASVLITYPLLHEHNPAHGASRRDDAVKK